MPSPVSGNLYVTPMIYGSGDVAQQQLALRFTPDGYFVIPQQSLPQPVVFTPVGPNNNMPGGGVEGTVQLPIPVGPSQWVPLKR
jgi:hypothetical protein